MFETLDSSKEVPETDTDLALNALTEPSALAVLHIPRLRAGSRVQYKGRTYEVESVVLRNYNIYLRLSGNGDQEIEEHLVQPAVDIVHVFPRHPVQPHQRRKTVA